MMQGDILIGPQCLLPGDMLILGMLVKRTYPVLAPEKSFTVEILCGKCCDVGAELGSTPQG